ncbi:hypothetical protein RFI_00756 [Reticulomyxa filosa]|uniref:RGS domain-containing protein n=1 Tax=Reticulomyxa filosa TaxID=46433 RepID=X6PCQ2_RETFI|nr:hypothetical protein RFI_00756 [Reticulomyxa filosa]|eukprot:ETO36305.1 hypothetical protein RFI_00756 [Reticulomyxa filosa]
MFFVYGNSGALGLLLTRVWLLLRSRTGTKGVPPKKKKKFIHIFVHVYIYAYTHFFFWDKKRMLYYNIHYNIALSNGKWMTKIDSNALSDKKNSSYKWFVATENKSTLGNPKWLLTRLLLPTYLIGATIVFFCDINKWESFGRIGADGCILIVTLFVILIWFVFFVFHFFIESHPIKFFIKKNKTKKNITFFFKKKRVRMPAYVDYIYLKRELKDLLFWGLYFVVVHGMLSIVVVTAPQYLSYFWYSSINIPILCVGYLGTLISTNYKVLKWNNLLGFIEDHRDTIKHLSPFPSTTIDRQQIHQQNTLIRSFLLYSSKPFFRPRVKDDPPEGNYNYNHDHNANPNLNINLPNSSHFDKRFVLSLENILSNIQSLHIFMDFLFAEFAHENLIGLPLLHAYICTLARIQFVALFLMCIHVCIHIGLIELIQFKTFVLSQTSDEETPNRETHKSLLPESIVRSEIVFNTSKTILEKFQLLVAKFITTDAPYCLNISHSQRMALVFLSKQKNLDDYSTTQIASFFDECIREMFGLIRDSFARFTKTDMYEKLCEYHEH